MRQQGAERQDGARGGAEAKGGAGDEGDTRDGEEAAGLRFNTLEKRRGLYPPPFFVYLKEENEWSLLNMDFFREKNII